MEKPFQTDFPIKFVKYAQYLPRLIEKIDSKRHFLATVSPLKKPDPLVLRLSDPLPARRLAAPQLVAHLDVG